MIPPPKGKPSDRAYTTLPFVPIEVRTPLSHRLAHSAHDAWYRWALAKKGLPLTFIPIEVVPPLEPVWGESFEAYNLWRKSTMPFDQLDPHNTTDGLDLTDGDRYLSRMDKRYLSVTPGNGLTYIPPSDGAWDKGAAPDNEHITPRGEQEAMTDTTNPTPVTMPLITLTDGNTGGINVPNPESVTLPYVLSKHLYTSPVEEPSPEGPAPFTTYLEYLTTIKAVYATLKANGTHKQVGIALAVLSANWLGDMLYNMVPFSGVPMTVGVLCLSSLLLRSNREKLVQVMKEYVE